MRSAYCGSLNGVSAVVVTRSVENYEEGRGPYVADGEGSVKGGGDSGYGALLSKDQELSRMY